MKRSLLGMAVFFLVALAAITVLKRVGGSAGDSARDRGRTERIREFWDIYHRATELRNAGDFRSAAAAYRRALEVQPWHQDSLFYLAVSLQESGDYPEATRVLRSLTERYPADGRALTQLGALLSTPVPGAELDFEEAAEAFARSQALNREHSGPFVNQGLLELNRGDRERAREPLATAAKGGAPEPLFLLGLVDFLEGRDLSAAERFLRVLEANAREKAITGRGVLSEGDVKKGSATDLTSFEKAGLKSLLFLYWTSRRLGTYPDSVAEGFRLSLDSSSPIAWAKAGLEDPSSARGAWIDYDRDGRWDLLWISKDRVRLFCGRGGWEDVTEEAGLARIGGAKDALALDFDEDGWSDLYLFGSIPSGRAKNRLLRNRQGSFEDATERWRLSGERSTLAVASADFDGDGREDLLEFGARLGDVSPVRLFLNRGDRFEERGREWGLSFDGHGVDAAVSDFDRDGRPDLLLLGWQTEVRLFRNTGSRFVELSSRAGLENVGGGGTSALFFDLNRDPWPDLLVTAHARLEHSLLRLLKPELGAAGRTPQLFLGSSGGRFEEATARVGLDRSFGVIKAVASDFDADGWMDLFFAQGGFDGAHYEPSLVLRNESGRRLVPWSYVPSVENPVRALDVEVADLDRDGRPDVFLSGAGILLNRKRKEP